MANVTDADIARWRALKDEGMVSSVGEYTPLEFWDILDALESERKATRELVEALFKARHRLLKEGFKPNDPTVRNINEALAKHTGGE